MLETFSLTFKQCFCKKIPSENCRTNLLNQVFLSRRSFLWIVIRKLLWFLKCTSILICLNDSTLIISSLKCNNTFFLWVLTFYISTKGATKLQFTHYSCVVIISFSTGLYKSIFLPILLESLFIVLCFLHFLRQKIQIACFVFWISMSFL